MHQTHLIFFILTDQYVVKYEHLPYISHLYLHIRGTVPYVRGTVPYIHCSIFLTYYFKIYNYFFLIMKWNN